MPLLQSHLLDILLPPIHIQTDPRDSTGRITITLIALRQQTLLFLQLQTVRPRASLLPLSRVHLHLPSPMAAAPTQTAGSTKVGQAPKGRFSTHSNHTNLLHRLIYLLSITIIVHTASRISPRVKYSSRSSNFSLNLSIRLLHASTGPHSWPISTADARNATLSSLLLS